MYPEIACIDLEVDRNVPEVIVHRPSYVDPRPSGDTKEKGDVHRQCDIFLTILTILAMVGYLCYMYVLVPDQKDPQDSPQDTGIRIVPADQSRLEPKNVQTVTSMAKSSIRELRDRVARAGADASLESSSEASDLSNGLKVLIRDLVYHSSNSYPPIFLEHQAIEILRKKFGKSAIRERSNRFSRYQNKIQIQLNCLEVGIMRRVRSESVCLSAFRKFVDKTCQKYQEKYGRPACSNSQGADHAFEAFVQMTEEFCGVFQEAFDQDAERARGELRQMISIFGETPTNG